MGIAAKGSNALEWLLGPYRGIRTYVRIWGDSGDSARTRVRMPMCLAGYPRGVPNAYERVFALPCARVMSRCYGHVADCAVCYATPAQWLRTGCHKVGMVGPLRPLVTPCNASHRMKVPLRNRHSKPFLTRLARMALPPPTQPIVSDALHKRCRISNRQASADDQHSSRQRCPRRQRQGGTLRGAKGGTVDPLPRSRGAPPERAFGTPSRGRFGPPRRKGIQSYSY